MLKGNSSYMIIKESLWPNYQKYNRLRFKNPFCGLFELLMFSDIVANLLFISFIVYEDYLSSAFVCFNTSFIWMRTYLLGLRSCFGFKLVIYFVFLVLIWFVEIKGKNKQLILVVTWFAAPKITAKTLEGLIWNCFISSF